LNKPEKSMFQFKRSPGHVPEGMEPIVFGSEYVLAHRLEAERSLKILGLQKTSRILDVGCGTATATVALSEKGYRVVGLDISRSLLTIAKKRNQESGAEVALVLGDMLNLPFKDQVFDSVTCMDVTFGYFGPEGDLLQVKEMGRVLKRGGRLFVETFDKEYGIRNPGRAETGQYWGAYDPTTDRFSGQSLYDSQQWQQMLDRANMRLLKVLSADNYDLQYTDYCPGKKYIIILASKT